MKHNFLIRSALLTAAFTSVAAMGQEAPGGLAFDASKHQKSQGAQLSVTYPAGFSARESNRQRIVQSFVGSSDGVDLAMTLGVEAGEGDVEAYCASQTPDDWRKTFQGQASNMQVLDVQAVRWKNRPAILMTLGQITKLDGFQIYSRVQTLSICHKRYRVSLSCGTSAPTEAKVTVLMQKAQATCGRFYDSLIFKK